MRPRDDTAAETSYPRDGHPPDRAGCMDVADCPIEWVAWDGSGSGPTPLLIHGARAHCGWWSAVVAELRAHSLGAVALDLSGNGDSGWRRNYSAELWAAEAIAVVEGVLGGSAVLVGHSMGGQVALAAAAERPEIAPAVILLDTKIEQPTAATGGLPRGSPARRPRVYPSRAEAVASFRLLPEQPILNEELLREVAAESLREVEGGWRWKFDPAIAHRWTDDRIAAFARRVRCPVWVIRGELSDLTSARTTGNLQAITGMPVPGVTIPDAHHHLILDQPRRVGAALAEILSRREWETD